MRKRDVLIGAALAAVLLAPLPAAADAAGEIATAATHADLASQAGDLGGTRMHLHHALNCLVGPGGAGFDPKNLNPCTNAGHGALPDTADASRKTVLHGAAATARAGLATSDLGAAHAAAAQTAAMLKGLK